MRRIDPTVSRKLNGGKLIALRVLTEQVGLDARLVYSWAKRDGVDGHRLPTINLAGSRYTTIQAFNQFLSDEIDSSLPGEIDSQPGFRFARLA